MTTRHSPPRVIAAPTQRRITRRTSTPGGSSPHQVQPRLRLARTDRLGDLARRVPAASRRSQLPLLPLLLRRRLPSLPSYSEIPLSLDKSRVRGRGSHCNSAHFHFFCFEKRGNPVIPGRKREIRLLASGAATTCHTRHLLSRRVPLFLPSLLSVNHEAATLSQS